MIDKKAQAEPGSFRDPAGYVFYRGSGVYRQINRAFKDDFELFLRSKLYNKLLAQELITSFKKVDAGFISPGGYKVVECERLPFISYPYEWAFEALKDAALATLKIQKIALSHGMSLKDASCYNIQFIGSRPLLMDILSLEKYEEGTPWVAYRQFCQHFLSPLALMSYVDPRLNQLLRIHMDGVPLDLTSKLLPARTWLSFGIASHIHIHARSQARYGAREQKITKHKNSMSRFSLMSLLDNLEAAVSSLKLKIPDSLWHG